MEVASGLCDQGGQLSKFISANVKAPNEFLPPKDDSKEAKEAPPTPNPEYEDWVAKDQQVLNYCNKTDQLYEIK
jgi:hypothetical protein